MIGVAKVILLGNLTRDPEPVGQGGAAFGVATNRKFKDADGTQREEVCFTDCVAWDGLAERVVLPYAKKGGTVYVEGRLKYDQWTDAQGNKRHRLYVVVETLKLLDAKPAGHVPNTSGHAQGRQSEPVRNNPAPRQQAPRTTRNTLQRPNAPQTGGKSQQWNPDGDLGPLEDRF